MYCGFNWGHGTVLAENMKILHILQGLYLKNFLSNSYETFKYFGIRKDLFHGKINFAQSCILTI